MRPVKYLASAFLLCMLFSSGFSADASSGFEAEQGMVAGYSNPALFGLSAMRVVILPNSVMFPGTVESTDMVRRIEKRLIETDGRLQNVLQQGYAARYLNVPVLRININRIVISQNELPIYLISTVFSVEIFSAGNVVSTMQIDAWSRTETIRPSNVNSEYDAVLSVLLKHAELFAKDAGRANPVSGANVSSGNEALVTSEPVKEVVAEEAEPVKPIEYVGSKNSKVFHKSDCPWVQRILPANLIRYASREEAIAAEKKPCKKCKP